MNLQVNGVHHWFGEKNVLHNVNLEIDAGQIVGVVGPSGCGKSTLLRAILGTHPPRKGEILAGGVKRTTPTRDVGIVYQHYSLYDFLTVEENVAFGLMLDETEPWQRWFKPWWWWPLREKHMEKSRVMLEKVNLAKVAKQYPKELSGGMRQRVAIAQALVMEPKVLLLDEPFGALDEATREELQIMLLHLYQENEDAKNKGEAPPYTILIVTHELNEAIYVSDRILGLSQYHSSNIKEDGTFENSVGATIVYDRMAPVFMPTDAKEHEMFDQQREELRHAVFSERNCQHHDDYVTYWKNKKKVAV